MTYIAARSDGGANAPLVFTFHGTGGTEDQFHELAGKLVFDAHVVSPRGDVDEGGHLRFFKRTAEGVYDMQDLNRRTIAMAAFLKDEIDRVGAQRVIGMGYSNGANILASVMLSHPGLIDEAMLLHPLIPWTPEPQADLATKRILITAGRQDPICPAPKTEAFARYLTDQNAALTLHWHPGGHELRPDELTAMQTFLG